MSNIERRVQRLELHHTDMEGDDRLDAAFQRRLDEGLARAAKAREEHPEPPMTPEVAEKLERLKQQLLDALRPHTAKMAQRRRMMQRGMS